MPVINNTNIPRHKLVKILDKNSNSIINKNLIFDEELSFDLSSSFGSLWDAHGNNLLTLLSSGTNGKVPSGQFVMQGMQIWQSTDPLSFSLPLKLYSVNNAKDDVFIPALRLGQLTLPTKNNGSKGTSNEMLATLIPPGPNLTQILKNGGFTKLSDFLAEKTGVEAKGTYNVSVGGYVTFESVIITNCNPTFSKTVDDTGYPIQADIELKFTTSQIATTNMLENLIR